MLVTVRIRKPIFLKGPCYNQRTLHSISAYLHLNCSSVHLRRVCFKVLFSVCPSLSSGLPSFVYRWVFLFDKILLFTTRKYRFGAGIRYAVKSFHYVNELRVESHTAVRGRVSKCLCGHRVAWCSYMYTHTSCTYPIAKCTCTCTDNVTVIILKVCTPNFNK